MRLLILLLLPATIFAQIRPGPPTTDWQPQGQIIRNERATIEVFDDLGLLRKRTLWTAGISFASGLCYGIHETVVHKPFRIPDGWNRQWWDSRESWRNKYRNGDPAKGQAFPGSMGPLVWTTDAKHLFGGLYRAGMFGAGISVAIGEKRPVKHYIGQAVVSGLSFGAGFAVAYNTNLIFR